MISRPNPKPLPFRPQDRARGAGGTLEAALAAVRDRLVVHPSELSQALSYGERGGNDSRGIVIYLTEGEGIVLADGLRITRKKVRIYGTPNTVLRRRQTANLPMIDVKSTATDFRIEGVRFVDEAGSQPLVRTAADRTTVRDVYAESCHSLFVATDGDDLRVQDATVQTHRATDYVVHLDGTHVRCVVSGVTGNAPASTTALVRLDDGATESVIFGCIGSTNYTYVVDLLMTGTTNEQAGNSGAVNAR